MDKILNVIKVLVLRFSLFFILSVSFVLESDLLLISLIYTFN